MNKWPALKLWLVVLLFSAACGLVRRPAATPAPVPTRPVAERQLQVFDALFARARPVHPWRLRLRGLDRPGIQYRAVVAAGQSEEAFATGQLLEKLPPNSQLPTRAERLERKPGT